MKSIKNGNTKYLNLYHKIHHQNYINKFYDNLGIPINKNLGLELKDEYDGLKLQNRTMPLSEVASGTVNGVVGGVAVGMTGSSLFNAAITAAARQYRLSSCS